MSAIRLTGQLLPARLGGSESSAVHLLPAAIKHDGAAPVAAYFVPASRDGGCVEAAFRGRRMTGHTLDLAARGLVGARDDTG
jgi:hypothetical protein